MAVEMYLINYGVLGLWTISLLAEKFGTQKKLVELLIKIEMLLKK